MMKIIDAHTHTWTEQIISTEDIQARRIAAERDGTKPILDSPLSNLHEGMKSALIERSVVLPIDSGFHRSMPLTLQEKTDYHVKEVASHPNIDTFVGIDPRRGKEGVEELERAVVEKGCIGWKMYPPNGFYPDNDEFYPYYEKATDLKIPIVIHTGFTSRFKHVKYARPVFVDKVAADFPQLRIVLAHVGTPWTDEALMVSAKNPNVSVDVSGWQVYAKGSPLKLYQMLVDARMSRVFPTRMIWGSDYPLFEHVMPLKEWAEFFSNIQLPQQMLDSGYKPIKREDLEFVMWKNTARVFFGERS